MRALCATIFAAAMAATSHGATRNAVRQTLDEYVLSNRIAGVVSILSDADCNLTVDCSGWANVERRVPISTNTVFAIFSMTKTITGAAVMCAIVIAVAYYDPSMRKFAAIIVAFALLAYGQWFGAVAIAALAGYWFYMRKK